MPFVKPLRYSKTSLATLPSYQVLIPQQTWLGLDRTLCTLHLHSKIAYVVPRTRCLALALCIILIRLELRLAKHGAR
jgi:hypothetical protein